MANRRPLKQLKAAAAKLCDENCFCSYPCGYAKRNAGKLPLLRKNTVCPVAQYQAYTPNKPNTVEAWKAYAVTDDDVNLLCTHCQFRDSSQDTDDTILRSCFESHCLDCPVLSAADNLAESEAESRLS